MHVAEVHVGAVGIGKLLEEPDMASAIRHVFRFLAHIDRAFSWTFDATGRACVDTERAAGAVLSVDLQRVAGVGKTARVERSTEKTGGRGFQTGTVEKLGADHAVRANETALAALNAEIGIPLRHEARDVALFPGSSRGRVGAVRRQCADRQLFAATGHDRPGDPSHKLGSTVWNRRSDIGCRVGCVRYRQFAEPGKRGIDGGVIPGDYVLAFQGIGLVDRVLDLGDRDRRGHYVGNCKKAGLHDGIDALAEIVFTRDTIGIDGEYARRFVDDGLLHRTRQPLPYLFRRN